MEVFIYILLWILPFIFNGCLIYYVQYYSHNLHKDLDRDRKMLTGSLIPIVNIFLFITLFMIVGYDLFNRTFDKIYKK